MVYIEISTDLESMDKIKYDQLLRGRSKTLGTIRYLVVNNQLIYASLGPLKLTRGERIQIRTQARAPSRTKTGERCAVLCRLCTHTLQRSRFEAGVFVARTEWLPTDLFDVLIHPALQAGVPEPAKWRKLLQPNVKVLLDCTVRLVLEQQAA